MIYYIDKILRTTKTGKKFVKYQSFESFGREARQSYAWGNKERRGWGFVWMRPGETIDEAVDRTA